MSNLRMHAQCQLSKGRIPPLRRSALTKVEVLVAFLVVVILLVILIFLAKRHQTLRYRTMCAANLKGMGTGMYFHQELGGIPEDDWLIAPHVPAIEIGAGRVTYAPKIIGWNRGDGRDPESGKTTEEDIKISTTRNLWMLVRIGASSPKSFICPSSKDTPNQDDSPRLYWDFKNWNEVSYGYQVPYGKHGQPSSDRDGRMPLAADKEPYGAALENGQPYPGIPNMSAADDPVKWRKWNSPNHGGEGQNVLFADSHAEFMTKPTAGIKNDNVYTRWSGPEGSIEANETARAWGTPPTSNETPWSDTDSLIYP